MSIKNPYRPGSGLFPPYFAGRNREVSEFLKKYDMVKSGMPMHLAIIGDWAMGKTSLLTRFEHEIEKKCLVYNTIANVESTTEFFASLIRGIALKVRSKYGESILKKLGRKIGLRNLKISLFGLSAELSFRSVSDAEMSFREYLLSIWSELKKTGLEAIIILIDDLDAIEDFRTTMMTLRNTMMELSKTDFKGLVVISGTRKLFEKMYDVHAPLVRFFEPIELKNLVSNEAKLAIVRPLKNKIKIDENVIETIIEISDGQPYYLQEVCYHVFDASDKKRITLNDFDIGFDKAFSDIIKLMFERRVAKLSQHEFKVLTLFEAKKFYKYSDIMALAQKNHININTASTALHRLKNKDIVHQITIGSEKNSYVVGDALLLRYVKKNAR